LVGAGCETDISERITCVSNSAGIIYNTPGVVEHHCIVGLLVYVATHILASTRGSSLTLLSDGVEVWSSIIGTLLDYWNLIAYACVVEPAPVLLHKIISGGLSGT